MDVSIILVNYNTTRLLLQAIDSIYEKSAGFTFEVIVVDNNSSENPEKEIREKYGDQITLISLSENIGFGKANNEGIKIAKGRYIFLLNTDTYLINNAIYILMQYMDTHLDVGSCGGNLYNAQLQHTYSYHKIPYGIRSYEISELTLGFSRRFVKYPFYNTSENAIEVGNISGADMMLRKSVLDTVGTFDPDFFMYCEESEKIVEHRKLMELDGRKKYYIKTRGILYFKIANILLLCGVTLRCILYTLNNNRKLKKEYKKFGGLIYKAYYK